MDYKYELIYEGKAKKVFSHNDADKVIIEFRELTNNKNIEISLNLLKKFSQSWPKHEKPEEWVVKNKNTSKEKINYKFIK